MQLAKEKELAEIARDNALEETQTVRHRYRNIIGAEAFDKDSR